VTAPGGGLVDCHAAYRRQLDACPGTLNIVMDDTPTTWCRARPPAGRPS
jgi:hypothetical protein